MAKKKQDDVEMLAQLQANRTVELQDIIRRGAEMSKWVEEGNLKFLCEKILDPIESEVMQKIKDGKLTASMLTQFAAIQGMLNSMDRVKERINKIIQDATQARVEMSQIVDTVPTPEGG
jgi:hypothetical protein